MKWLFIVDLQSEGEERNEDEEKHEIIQTKRERERAIQASILRGRENRADKTLLSRVV